MTTDMVIWCGGLAILLMFVLASWLDWGDKENGKDNETKQDK